MQSIKSTLLLLFTLFFSSIFYAQETPTEDDEKLSLTEGTLDNQFDYVIKESNEWHRDYKVIKINWLTTLKAHTLDSLRIYKVDISEKQTVIDSQAKEIESLKSNLSITKTSLDDTRAEKDNMSLFGLQMSKTGYSMVMWAIIAVLLALVILFIIKFRNSNAITKQAKKTLAETEEEYEEHRRNSLEREQKVRRQLQDEINKHKTGK
jgi:hypothetical protein